MNILFIYFLAGTAAYVFLASKKDTLEIKLPALLFRWICNKPLLEPWVATGAYGFVVLAWPYFVLREFNN